LFIGGYLVGLGPREGMFKSRRGVQNLNYLRGASLEKVEGDWVMLLDEMSRIGWDSFPRTT